LLVDPADQSMLNLGQIDRMRRIVQVFLRAGVAELLDPRGRGDARLGRRLAAALADLGPTFVKLGQVLATREDLIPPGVARELAALEDRSPPFSAAAARRRIQSALGAPVEVVFARFDDEPLAAGSIAQIHRARTHAGVEVVVKVRRPGIRRVVEDDLALLAALAARVAARSPAVARHDPVGFVAELGKGLRRELDLAAEARALAAMATLLPRSSRVPRVYPTLSSGDVLTMEFVAGRRVRDLDDPALRRATARRLAACFAQQWLRGDLFHADPHAGNLMVGARGELVLLDLGAVGTLGARERGDLLRLAAAAAARRGDRMAGALLGMVHAPADLDRAAYERDMGRLCEQLTGRPMGEVRVGEAVQEAFALAQRHGLRFRAEHFLLMRSAMLVDGVLRSLDPALDPVRAVRAHVLRSCWRPRWTIPAAFLVASFVAARAQVLGRAIIRHVQRLVRLLPPRLLPVILVALLGCSRSSALPPRVADAAPPPRPDSPDAGLPPAPPGPIPAPPAAAPGAGRFEREELEAARAQLGEARQQLADKPFAAFRLGIAVEPFGALHHADVQSFFNNHRGAVWSCVATLEDPDAADVLVRYDGAGARDVAVFGADLVRRPDAERCIDELLAAGPLAGARSPARLLVVPGAIKPSPPP
jgi:ubiquinone biosynthesis protein